MTGTAFKRINVNVMLVNFRMTERLLKMLALTVTLRTLDRRLVVTIVSSLLTLTLPFNLDHNVTCECFN